MLGEGLAVGLGLDVGFLDDGLGVGVAVVDGLDVGLGLVLALALLLGLAVALALLLGLVLALLLGLELALEELLGLAFALADRLSLEVALANADEVLPGLPPADILTGVDMSPVSVTEATRTESFGIDEHATFTMGWLGNSVARAWPNMPQLM